MLIEVPIISILVQLNLIENQEIKTLILKIYVNYKKRLGVYKIKYILERDYGINISVGRVYRLIKSMISPKMSIYLKYIKNSQEGDCKNYLNQEFNQKAPNLVWVSDIAYIKVLGKWFYLCVIIDLFARKVIDNANFVISVFNKAYKIRKNPTSLIFNSDRGVQYTATSFRKLLDDYGVFQSFSKKGYHFDNAVSESFFKYLKKKKLTEKLTTQYKS